MATPLPCPNCQVILHLPDLLPGQFVQCPRCRAAFVAPVAQPLADPPSPERTEAAAQAAITEAPEILDVLPAPPLPPAVPLPSTMKRSRIRWIVGSVAAAAVVFLVVALGILWSLTRGSSPSQPPVDEVVAAPLSRLQPPELEDAVVSRLLPVPATGLAVGGSGRFFVLHLPERQQLAIFDVNQAKVTQTIPLGEPGAPFAAGKDRLLVVLPKARRIEHWDLVTGKRLAEAPLDVPFPVRAISMGSASRGPLLVHCRERGQGGV